MRPNSSRGKLQLYANPYDTSKKGFYFGDLDEYEAGVSRSRAEEFEIDFIDGTPAEQLLFETLKVDQGSVGEYFELLDEFDGDAERLVALTFLLDRGIPVKKALKQVEDVQMFEGTPEECAEQYLDDIGLDEKTAEMYFDYEKLGRDLRLGGDATRDLEDQLEELDEDDEDERERLQDEIDRVEKLDDQELGIEYVDSIGSLADAVGDRIESYFDYEAFGRDAVLNGEWDEFHFGGTDYVITNALEF